MDKVNFHSDKIFYEWAPTEQDQELIRLAQGCLERQKAFQQQIRQSAFTPHPNAAYEVSEEALRKILDAGKTIHGIGRERHISNVIVFNIPGVEGSVSNREILETRGKLDKAMFRSVTHLFRTRKELSVINSGYFWYPPGGYMGWHTNLGLPGWRLYITHAQEPGKSFFRYRDPDTSEIVTAWDREWNFRLFKIDPKRPFWHVVYSETNRYSFGYNIVPAEKPSFPLRVAKKAKQLFERAGAV